MKDKPLLDQIGEIAKRFANDLYTEELQKQVNEKERLEEVNKRKKEFLDHLKEENKQAYNDYYLIYDRLSKEESTKDNITEIKKHVQQIDNLLLVKSESQHQSDREFCFHLHQLKNQFIKLEALQERKQSLEKINDFEEVELSDKETFNDFNKVELSDKETFNDFNKPILTKKHLAFLMFELRKNKVFMRDITNTDMGNAFTILTGYSAKQLRKSLSEKYEFTEEDKNTLKSILNNLSKALEEVNSKNK